ncbi:MAG: hypothetical protein JWO98_2246 [Frankiales bacterium]|nr:hypothetical protein [Frankiales bacterium]
MSRRTLRDRWYAEIIRTKLVTGPCRELLSLMAVMHMDDRGYVKVPRDQLADELGISAHRVTVLIGQATKAGLLVKVGGGHNGQTSRYAAQLIEGCPERATFRLSRYRAESTLQRHPSGGGNEGEGCPEQAPIRVRATKNNREQEPAPDGTREEREHDVTSQAGTNRSWLPTPLRARLPTAQGDRA